MGGPVAPGAAATTVGSWVLVRQGYEHDELLIRHELVHVEQYHRLGLVGFLVRYVGAYLRWRARLALFAVCTTALIVSTYLLTRDAIA